MNLLDHIRNVPDFPSPGIQFKDITPLLHHPLAFNRVIDLLGERYAGAGLSQVVGIESRGFIFGAALAHHLGIGFVPVRKLGKLPAKTIKKSYALEYGEATIELHTDVLGPDDSVVIIDDLLATGGTLEATADLVSQTGASIHEIWVLVELAFLPGRQRIADYPVHAEMIIND